jgi:DNA-binding IclR family transcriptional regulator
MSLTADQRRTLRLLAQVRAMKAEGMGATEIAKALKIGRASVYRALEGA